MTYRLKDNLFIAGRTGSGKSYFFKHTVLPLLLRDGRQIIILDMKREYNLGTIVDINVLGSIHDLARVTVGYNPRTETFHPPRIVVIQAHRYTIEKIDMVFEFLNYTSEKILVFEESSFYFGHPKIKTGYIPEETDVFLRTGTNQHNAGHNLILITQYPNDIPKKVLSVCSKGYLFYLPMSALKYLYEKQFIEDDPEFVKEQISPFRSYRMYEVV